MLRSIRTGAWACALILAGLPHGARAELSISGTADKISLQLSDPTPAADVVAAVAGAFGASVSGDPGQEMLSPNDLENMSITQALTILLPNKQFTIRFGGVPPMPAAIIFLKPSSQATPAVTIVDGSPLAESEIQPGRLVPDEKMDEFIKNLPMLKTR